MLTPAIFIIIIIINITVMVAVVVVVVVVVVDSYYSACWEWFSGVLLWAL
jgi:hypothetical protein